MAKIQLTPEVLKSQGNQMAAISSSYQSSLKNVNAVLKSVNSHWSKNLTNNFTGKITECTNMGNSLASLLDATVNAIEQTGTKFDELDKNLAKAMGDGSDSKSRGKAGASQKKTQNDVAKTFSDVYKLYEQLPEEWQAFADIVMKYVTGSETTKVMKLLMKLSAGKLKWADAWDVVDVVGSTLFSGVGGSSLGLTPFGIIFTTTKTLFTSHWDKFNYYENMGGIRGVAGQFVQEGKLLVDVAAKLVDSTFKLSEINTAIRIYSKMNFGKELNLGKGFNNYTRVVNNFYDGLVTGKIFTTKGSIKLYKDVMSIFDSKTYFGPNLKK